MAVKAVNDTVGPHDLCPSLLVFGTLPKLPDISPRDLPTQRERKRAVVSAREEYEKIVGKRIIARDIRAIPPPAVRHKFVPGDFAYVYREGLKHYTGPHRIASVNGKDVRVHTGEHSGPRSF